MPMQPLDDELEPDRPVNDNGPVASGAPQRSTTPAEDLVTAIRFFSRLPLSGAPHQPPRLDGIARVLPVASLFIGLGPAVLLIAAIFVHLPALYAAGLAVLAGIVVTGGMAEDALADSADGLFGGATPERRLAILKDSRHGTFGVLALVLLVLMRAGALAAMAENNALAAAGAWLSAGILARSAGLWLSVALPPARSFGASATAGRVGRGSFATGLLLALLIAIGIGLPAVGAPALIFGLVVSAAVMAGWTELCRRLVGGQTGDLIGALMALIELVLLGAFSLAFFA